MFDENYIKDTAKMINESEKRQGENMRTFQGYPIQLFPSDLLVLSVTLQCYKPDIIIELGTGTGASALFFSEYAQVVTYDSVDRRIEKLKNNSDIDFRELDIFSESGNNQIKYFLSHWRRLFLFCDNGDKPKEFKTFVPMLFKGQVVGVHDFGLEIQQKDVQEFIDNGSVKEVDYNGNDSLIRIYDKEI